MDLLLTGVEKLTAAVNNASSDPEQVEEAQRVLQIFIKNIDQVDSSYKSARRRMSTTPTSAQISSPPKLNLSGHAHQDSSDSTTSSNQNTERSGAQSVPSTPNSKTEGGMQHSSTTPEIKKKKSYSVSSKKSKSKLTDNEIEAENKDGDKKKRTHSRRTTLSLALPVKKEKEQKDEEKQKEKEKKEKKSKFESRLNNHLITQRR